MHVSAACRPGSSLGSEGAFNIDDANDDSFGDYDNMLLGCHPTAGDDNGDGDYDNDDTFGDNSNEEEWEMPGAASAGYDVSAALACLLCRGCFVCDLALLLL
jgi:hypothetical protein